MGYIERRAKLSEQLFEMQKAQGSPLGLNKKTSNLFRSVDRSNARIDVSDFNHVLNVNAEELYADVEGMTTYGDFVDETLKFCLMPAVVPQLKSITVGGAYAGGGIESSSFRYGLVHEAILEAEILLGDGRVVLCRPDNEHKDLFFSFANSYGSLGYALRIRVRLVPVKKYVKIRHQHFGAPTDYFERFEAVCSENRTSGHYAFIDGVVFDSSEMYISTGELTDEAPYINDYTYMQIYYRSIQQRTEDYLTIKDYIWRWDADWFWCSKVFFMQNTIVRALLGKFFLSSTFYAKVMHFSDKLSFIKKLASFGKTRHESVIQDILIPIDNAEKFFRFYVKEINIFPLWICPSMSSSADRSFPFFPLNPETLYLDFGFWDSIKSSHPPGHYNRMIEKETLLQKGFKSLYSECYYTEDEFWHIYDKALYHELKIKYDPYSSLKSLYEKIK